MWEGWAGVAETPGSIALSSASDSGPVAEPEHGPPGSTAEQLAGPRVELPGRSYLLLHGPLDAVRFVGDQATPRLVPPAVAQPVVAGDVEPEDSLTWDGDQVE